MLLFKNMLNTAFTFLILVTLILSSSTGRRITFQNNSPLQTTRQSSIPSCVCVLYFNCDWENIVITNGESLIDKGHSMLEDTEMESLCYDYLEVCCRLPEVPAENRRCGLRRSHNLNPDIPKLDKEEAELGEFPWLVTIFRTKTVQRNNQTEEIKVYQCQGTLIHKRVVITAAQCIQNLGNASELLLIRAGQLDTMTTLREYSYQEHDVRKVVIHKSYNPQTLSKNFALLILKTPVKINDNVDITCLADHRDDVDEDKCLVVGWDKFLTPEDANSQKSQTNILKKRIEPYVSTTQCTRLLRKTPLGKRFRLDNSFICAGGTSSKNFCSREIGTPLMCPLKSEPNQYVQLGIASWCISSGNLQIPSVFANILHVRKWIDTEMANAHLSSSVYRAKRSWKS